jgi:hypothetical protein
MLKRLSYAALGMLLAGAVPAASCSYTDYLVIPTNKNRFLDTALSSIGLTVEELDGNIVDGVERICHLEQKANLTELYIAGGAVLYASNAILFSDGDMALAYYDDVKEFLEARMEFRDSVGAPILDTNYLETHNFFDDEATASEVVLSYLYDYEGEQFVVYLESYPADDGHPLRVD